MSKIPTVSIAHWVGQHVSQALGRGSTPSIYLYLFLRKKTISTILGLFHFCFYKLNIFFISWRYLKNEKVELCRYFVFFIYIFISSLVFSTSQRNFYYYPNCSTGQIFWTMQQQFMRSTSKYLQAPNGPFQKNLQFSEAETLWRKVVRENFDNGSFWEHKEFPYEVFLFQKTKNMKNVIPLLSIVLRHQEFSETTKETPHEVFLEDKNFSTTSCNTPLYGSPKLLDSTIEQQISLQKQQRPEILRKTKTTILLNFRYFEIKHYRYFSVITSDSSPEFFHGQMSNLLFYLFTVCFIFSPKFIRKENNQFISAILSFSRSCESHINFVSQIFQSHVTYIYGVPTQMAYPKWNAPKL